MCVAPEGGVIYSVDYGLLVFRSSAAFSINKKVDEWKTTERERETTDYWPVVVEGTRNTSPYCGFSPSPTMSPFTALDDKQHGEAIC